MALATPLRALTGGVAPNVHFAATANPSSTSDGTGDNSNPYAIIIDRNVFRLNPPPPPPSAEKKPVDLPKVYLNGIVRVGDDVRVLFSIPPKDAKSQTTYFKLAPGEKDDVLELVGIHPDQQEVDVLVSGTAMTLSVFSNSLASAGGKAAGGGTAPAPAVLRGGPPAPAPAAAAAAPGDSSAIVVGGGRSSSPYGGVTVGGGGGGGVTTIGGGNSISFGGGGGGGVSVSGGGATAVGGGNSISFGGSAGVTVGGGGGSSFSGGGGSGFGGGGVSSTSFGGGVSVSGGASVNTAGTQLATTLSSGTQTQAQTVNALTAPPASPEQQAIGLLSEYTKDPANSPPLPPSLASMVNGGNGSGPPMPGSTTGSQPPSPWSSGRVYQLPPAPP